jgi:hydrogenase-4 component H
MRYPKLRELKEAIKAIFKGPYTIKYPFGPFTPPASFRGKPQPSQEGCIGCGACAEVCPTGAIHLQESGTERILVWYYDECVFCGQCERNCTTREERVPGVKLTQEFDLAAVDRKTIRSEEIKKELVICSHCGTIISTKEHLLWVAKRLGHKVYGNINLLSIISKKFFSNTDNVKFKQFNQRENVYELMCPKCRRLTLLFDEYGKI